MFEAMGKLVARIEPGIKEIEINVTSALGTGFVLRGALSRKLLHSAAVQEMYLDLPHRQQLGIYNSPILGTYCPGV
jgi:hypothetical protein